MRLLSCWMEMTGCFMTRFYTSWITRTVAGACMSPTANSGTLMTTSCWRSAGLVSTRRACGAPGPTGGTARGGRNTCAPRVELLAHPEDYFKRVDGTWLRVCTDVAEMMFLLEAAEERHANVGQPLLAYNRMNSRRHGNSYNQHHLHREEATYRQRVLRASPPAC